MGHGLRPRGGGCSVRLQPVKRKYPSYRVQFYIGDVVYAYSDRGWGPVEQAKLYLTKGNAVAALTHLRRHEVFRDRSSRFFGCAQYLHLVGLPNPRESCEGDRIKVCRPDGPQRDWDEVMVEQGSQRRLADYRQRRKR